jgi:hypothetical protein
VGSRRSIAAVYFAALLLFRPQEGRCPTTLPEADKLVWSEDIDHSCNGWVREAQTRFPHPFVFICHGLEDSDKVWTLNPDNRTTGTDTETVAWVLSTMMPDRDIVLITCNQHGLRLKNPPPNVWYSTGPVWSKPRRFCGPQEQPPDRHTSSIWEFVNGSNQVAFR